MTTQTRTSGSDAATLGLGSVLAGSLPATLMTENAPDRYTVEAVFTRRPEHDEVTELVGSRTRDTLTQAGYPTVELTVSDRRLEIANTNLLELRDGLSTVLADLLAEISAGVRARRSAAAVRFQDAAASEHVRAAAVAELVGTVTFHNSTAAPGAGVADSGDLDASDLAQLDEWRDEGGHAARP